MRLRLNPDKEKELRKYCSLEMQAALAEIDHLRSCLLDMEFVRGERDEYKRQAQVFSTARDRWMESSDKYKQLSQARENRIAKLRACAKFYAGLAGDSEWDGCKFLTFDKFGGLCEEISGPYVAKKALVQDDLQAGKELEAMPEDK